MEKSEQNRTPGVVKQWVFGDNESNLGVTIDVFEDNMHQPRIWVDGSLLIDEAEYFPTLAEAIRYVQQNLVEIFVQDHDMSVYPKPEEIIGLAPMYNSGDEFWEWTPINRHYQECWWEGSDFEDPASRPVEINLFPVADTN